MPQSRMHRHTDEQESTNYRFLLKCMAALAATAVVTASIIATTTTKAGVITTTAITGKAALAATATASPPLLPVAALLLIVGGVCLLPFLFRGNTITVSSPGRYHHWGYRYRPPVCPLRFFIHQLHILTHIFIDIPPILLGSLMFTEIINMAITLHHAPHNTIMATQILTAILTSIDKSSKFNIPKLLQNARF